MHAPGARAKKKQEMASSAALFLKAEELEAKETRKAARKAMKEAQEEEEVENRLMAEGGRAVHFARMAEKEAAWRDGFKYGLEFMEKQAWSDGWRARYKGLTREDAWASRCAGTS